MIEKESHSWNEDCLNDRLGMISTAVMPVLLYRELGVPRARRRKYHSGGMPSSGITARGEFLLLFAVYFMVKVLDVRVPTNLEGFSFSLSFVRPSPHTANQLFSGVRFSPPPRDALVIVHTHYPSSTTHSTIIFNNSYCIFPLSLNTKNFTFPILFISG